MLAMNKVNKSYYPLNQKNLYKYKNLQLKQNQILQNNKYPDHKQNILHRNLHRTVIILKIKHHLNKSMLKLSQIIHLVDVWIHFKIALKAE